MNDENFSKIFNWKSLKTKLSFLSVYFIILSFAHKKLVRWKPRLILIGLYKVDSVELLMPCFEKNENFVTIFVSEVNHKKSASHITSALSCESFTYH